MHPSFFSFFPLPDMHLLIFHVNRTPKDVALNNAYEHAHVISLSLSLSINYARVISFLIFFFFFFFLSYVSLNEDKKEASHIYKHEKSKGTYFQEKQIKLTLYRLQCKTGEGNKIP